MEIDKDIRQVTFRNGYSKAMVNILFTNNWMMERIKRFVKTADLTPQQYNILRILRGAGQPLSTLQIREKMLDKMSDTSRMVERLVAKGLVQKSVSEKDKRLVDVTITNQGQEVLDKLDTRNNELDNILQNLTEDEAENLSCLLDKLRNHQ
jgi:DNA-binding MarR family transcriptional regulator